ncbi:MAG: ribosomal L7Ae/L30e/S12e/Gadd45 family protein [Eubacterium sp.]|nr:ribosomal L7Ae/L30e/S12e/Gadd45 family protein [Eubacterium sp.]
MLKDKTLSMLGLARRAGKLAMGHDMAEQSVKKKKAKMLLLCSDTSPRLCSEFEKTLAVNNIDIPIYKADITMNEIHFSVGYKAGVMTIEDENFTKRIIELLEQEENANGN